jgi:hypothetical protein
MEADPSQTANVPSPRGRAGPKRLLGLAPIALLFAMLYAALYSVRQLTNPTKPQTAVGKDRFFKTDEEAARIDSDGVSLSTSTLERRLKLIRTETPPTVNYPKNQQFGKPPNIPGMNFDDFDDYVPVSVRLGPYERDLTSRTIGLQHVRRPRHHPTLA